MNFYFKAARNIPFCKVRVQWHLDSKGGKKPKLLFFCASQFIILSYITLTFSLFIMKKKKSGWIYFGDSHTFMYVSK